MNEPRKNTISIVFLLFVFYVLALLKLILLKDSQYFFFLHFKEYYSRQLIEVKFNAMNLTPLKTILYYLRGEDTTGTIPNLLGNILLFVPMGFFIPLLFKKFRTMKRIVFIAFCASLFFEITQFITAYGTSDIDDCILNVLGASIGFFIYKLQQLPFLFKTENI